jgi:hypothetical protein
MLSAVLFCAENISGDGALKQMVSALVPIDDSFVPRHEGWRFEKDCTSYTYLQ